MTFNLTFETVKGHLYHTLFLRSKSLWLFFIVGGMSQNLQIDINTSTLCLNWLGTAEANDEVDTM